MAPKKKVAGVDQKAADRGEARPTPPVGFLFVPTSWSSARRTTRDEENQRDVIGITVYEET